MPRRSRLDAELVRRGLARSRGEAAALVSEGRVLVAGRPAAKPATGVTVDEPLRLRPVPDAPRYASRGGVKLAAALDTFEVNVAGRRCLDAGASTGGFTDVLLRRHAAAVVAVDVGYGQLAWSLRGDSRVLVLERTNVRTLTLDQVGSPADLVVADLSFISLRLVLASMRGCSTGDGDFVLLVKPQFEAGRDAVRARGVVSDPDVRAGTVMAVAGAAAALDLGTAGVTASPLPGPAGNVEYFLWLRADATLVDDDAVRRAVAVGPQ